ncbi:MAG TPA: TOBE domain-containing protein [Syntrophomonadaceae bacterium]|nr:TOBE domain-containing protein [Syntrophomonadaceae bacterium]
MRISDPNKLIGKVMEVKEGQDMSEVIVDIGDFAVTATITSGAAQALALKKGDEVFAMFNSTDVSLIKG